MSEKRDGFDPIAIITELEAWTKKLPDPALALKLQNTVALILQQYIKGDGPGGIEGWQVYSLKDAYAPRPPQEYVVYELFPLPSLSIVYGAPGTFKSLLMADMGICVSAGLPWLPPLPGHNEETSKLTKQVPVLWLDFDNGIRRTHERVEALARFRNLPESTPFHYVSMPSPWLNADSLTAIAGLIGLVKSLKARLIIVDNLGVVCGKADENSAEMAHVLANFRRIAEETESAVILIHHQRKLTGLKGRAGDALRGHSSIEAAIDLALLVERDEHADSVRVKSTKSRGVDVLPFGALFTYEHKEGTVELAKAIFYGQPIEDLVSEAAIRRSILEIVGEKPKINKGDLTDQVKERLPEVGVNRIRDNIDYLAHTGRLVIEISERNAKLYSLPKHPNQVDQIPF